jgi:hypothetical protein
MERTPTFVATKPLPVDLRRELHRAAHTNSHPRISFASNARQQSCHNARCTPNQGGHPKLFNAYQIVSNRSGRIKTSRKKIPVQKKSETFREGRFKKIT